MGHAILSCPRCGHVEFVADSSPLLQHLELVAVDTGDVQADSAGGPLKVATPSTSAHAADWYSAAER